MMTIAYKSNQSKKTKIKINLQLSVSVFIMLVLHGNVNIKFLLDSQTVYCKFLAKIIVYKQFIVLLRLALKYTFTFIQSCLNSPSILSTKMDGDKGFDQGTIFF